MLVLPGPPVSLAIQPSVAPGVHAIPRRGAKPFQYVLVKPRGTPLSPGNTRPKGNTALFGPLFSPQSPGCKPRAAAFSAESQHGYCVVACPGRNVCKRSPVS